MNTLSKITLPIGIKRFYLHFESRIYVHKQGRWPPSQRVNRVKSQ